MTPFDAFEVAQCAEYADPHGGTEVERLDGTEDPDQLAEAIATFWTVYGHRSWPEYGPGDYSHLTPQDAADGQYGATAIADYPTHAEARAMADALAYGRPIYDDGAA